MDLLQECSPEHLCIGKVTELRKREKSKVGTKKKFRRANRISGQQLPRGRYSANQWVNRHIRLTNVEAQTFAVLNFKAFLNQMFFVNCFGKLNVFDHFGQFLKNIQ